MDTTTYPGLFATKTESCLKGYAEKVPPEQLHQRDGQVWYIPHHSVCHQQKGKLWVMFDCTSSCKGTSLNRELLQGPWLNEYSHWSSPQVLPRLLSWQTDLHLVEHCFNMTITRMFSDFWNMDIGQWNMDCDFHFQSHHQEQSPHQKRYPLSC